MKIHTPLIAASLLLLPQAAAVAGDLVTIPAETSKSMKKGKKLSLVWKSPDFDGSKGCEIGRLTSETDDDANPVLKWFPESLKSIVRAGSPYKLHLAVVSARISEQANGTSIVRVEVEGRVVDQGGALVAAFDTRANSSSGGNSSDNARLAVREVVFDIAKDLFTVGVPSNEKSSAVIVAAPAPEKPPSAPVAKPSAIIVAGPSPAAIPSQPQNPVPMAAAQTEKAPIPSSPIPETKPTTTPETAPLSGPKPAAAVKPEPSAAVVIPPTPLSTPLPASITKNMKRGSALGKVWISPDYNRAQGFSIGEIKYLVDERNPGISGYLPEALAEISKQDAPYTLHMGIVELAIRTGRVNSSVNFAVEGRLVSKDGTVVAAFSTRESLTGGDDITDNCRTAAKRVIQAISKELR